MNFLKQLGFTFAAGLLLQYFLPWWTLAIGAFASGYFLENSGFKSFMAGFLGIALLWLTVAFWLDIQNASLLSDKVNVILPINVFLLTALVGGLTGGFAAWTGSNLKSNS